MSPYYQIFTALVSMTVLVSIVAAFAYILIGHG
jgi:hypothetical protein